ncbi:MAG TPA: maltotransferase domain-containing protein [Vicinamibacterales bacterium]|nr:maltotransferase domain-containing protein [Vicinamibacterales bacterium]
MPPRPKAAADGGPAGLASRPPRPVIGNVQPQIDGGRFPAKRTIGETVTVQADIFADGHDVVTAALRYREREYSGTTPPGEWRELPMQPIGNDRWEGRFPVDRVALYEFTIHAWIDGFGTWRETLSKKIAAEQPVELELQEGVLMLRAALARLDGAARPRGRGKRAPGGGVRTRQRAQAEPAGVADDEGPAAQPDRERLNGFLAALEGGDETKRRAAALSPELAALMRRYDNRAGAAILDPPLVVLGERERARYGAWYEMFPRSYSPDARRSATFDEAAQRLPGIAEMGFDVVYLAPVHPIGTTFRKGRNNSLVAAPGDPGSPWAIGSEEGGHKAVEPGLGTIEDFDRFVEVARRLGLEVALDLAYQTSPDHPYAKEHPEWFRRRTDGTVKCAENPPKKYQDIYPFDFDTDDWQALWTELRSIVLFWIGHGVKIFRVDNPHTKPFPFWEWMLGEIRREHPDTVFLSEAFTRPKVMRHLAKLGFSQSYTYFTWRNSKAELTDYFTELAQTDVREYLRPNLFANTPDILHEYLQRGGPPAFRARFLLAATLGASYGIYSGFEVCEGRAVREGSEEYLDSEKYQFRYWDWNQPGNLRALITRVNTIRREHASLQADWGLRFRQTDNDHLLCYSKQSSDGADAVLVVVNLDPFYMQHGWIRVPLAELGIAPGRGFEAHDLLSGETYYWRDEWNYVRLDPQVRPGHILRLTAS